MNASFLKMLGLDPKELEKTFGDVQQGITGALAEIRASSQAMLDEQRKTNELLARLLQHNEENSGG